MAKQSMIQREKKRERLVAKYANKRESIKEELKKVNSFQERLTLYKKLGPTFVGIGFCSSF